MSNSAPHEPHETIPSEGSVDTTDSEVQPQKRRALRNAGRMIGTGLWKSTALDVIVRDVRRIRPVNPRVWKDVFSRKGWNAAKRLVTGKSAAKGTDGKYPDTSGFCRIVAPAIASAVLGVLIAIYGMYFASTLADQVGAPLVNKIIALILTAFGLIYAITNSTTAAVALVKLNHSSKPVSPKRMKK